MVFFHAHPDDESIATGGTMARASEVGHRVVLVVATDGEEGEVDDGVLSEDESLEDRRRVETHAAADILGVHRVAFLGYRDSGMMGTATNDHPACFWQADREEAAERLAAILSEEGADVVTVYDANGGYGHPDHIQVHRVGHRAAEIAGVPRVFEATLNRDRIAEMAEQARADGVETPASDADEGSEELTVGVPDADITTVVDVGAHVEQKRRAMKAHASQIGEDSWFLTLPEEMFGNVFGREWFIRTTPPFEGSIPDDRESWLLP